MLASLLNCSVGKNCVQCTKIFRAVRFSSHSRRGESLADRLHPWEWMGSHCKHKSQAGMISVQQILSMKEWLAQGPPANMQQTYFNSELPCAKPTILSLDWVTLPNMHLLLACNAATHEVSGAGKTWHSFIGRKGAQLFGCCESCSCFY